MTSIEAAETPRPPLRIWHGWDTPEEAASPHPREPGLDQLDAPALIDRLANTAPEASRPTLRRYLEHKHSAGLKHNSIKGIGGALAKFARALDTTGTGMENAHEDEITLALARLRDGLSPSSHQLHVTHVRAFYRWLHHGDLPRAIARAAPREKAASHPTPSTLSLAAFQELLNACESLRDESETRLKAMLWTLWDGGLTRSELISLRLRDILINTDGSITLHLGLHSRQTPTKNEAHRAIGITEASPYLRAWLDFHPHRHDPEACLWPSPENPRQPVLPGGLNATLARLSRHAGLSLVSPKQLRDTRIRRAADDGWHEARMRSYFGWSATSTRPARFTEASSSVESI